MWRIIRKDFAVRCRKSKEELETGAFCIIWAQIFSLSSHGPIMCLSSWTEIEISSDSLFCASVSGLRLSFQCYNEAIGHGSLTSLVLEILPKHANFLSEFLKLYFKNRSECRTDSGNIVYFFLHVDKCRQIRTICIDVIDWVKCLWTTVIFLSSRNWRIKQRVDDTDCILFREFKLKTSSKNFEKSHDKTERWGVICFKQFGCF